MIQNKNYIHIPILLLFLMVPINALALKILRTSGQKILLDLEGEEAQLNQNLILSDSNRKKNAVAKITKQKNGRAIAEINKFSYAELIKNQVVFVNTKKTDNQSSIIAVNNKDVIKIANNKNPNDPKGTYKISFLFGASIDSMLVTQKTNLKKEDVSLTGGALGLSAALDAKINELLVLRSTFGYDPFNAFGISKEFMCDNLSSSDCSADLRFVSTGAYMRFNMSDLRSRDVIWSAVGATIKMPVYKTTTALKEKDIKLITSTVLSIGLDHYIDKYNYLPISVDYQIYQYSSDVKANSLTFRFGYGINY